MDPYDVFDMVVCLKRMMRDLRMISQMCWMWNDEQEYGDKWSKR